MKLIFCSDPLNTDTVDEAYAQESEIALKIGLSYDIFSFEDLTVFNNPKSALNKVSVSETEVPIIYRGWMLDISAYEKLFHALKEKGLTLINDPVQYSHCHYLPDNYPIIRDYTSLSVWLPNGSDLTISKIMKHLEIFNGKPVILKDYVKSQKHYWHEACFIPDSSEAEKVEKVLSKFLELQDDNLYGGLVFREFLEFEPIGNHHISGMPLAKEFRIFYMYNQILMYSQYWSDEYYDSELPDFNKFNKIAQNIQSNFFTMDVAKTKEGKWVIIELGDAQVAGLPEKTDIAEFYKKIKQIYG